MLRSLNSCTHFSRNVIRVCARTGRIKPFQRRLMPNGSDEHINVQVSCPSDGGTLMRGMMMGNNTQLCYFSDWSSHGSDLTSYDAAAETTTANGGKPLPPKVILQSYSPTGFDVLNAIKNVSDDQQESLSGELHMHGSIMVFPRACFLWNVTKAEDITLESLSAVTLLPHLEYLFIGYNGKKGAMLRSELERIENVMRLRNVVVEQTSLTYAMGTYNILNAEDRQVVAALILDDDDDE